MPEWVGHWTRDQKVWCSILAIGYVYKCLINFLYHTASVHPAVMGTWWNKNYSTVVVIGCSCRKMIIKVSGHQHGWLADGYDLEIGHF